MADVVSLTLEQRALATRAFADALTAELAKLPRLTHEQRDRMMRIAGAIIETGMESGQSADDLIPHFAMLFALARYRPNGRRKTGKHGRPRNVSILYPSKEQKRRIAREKRQDGEGKRGPRRGTVPLPPKHAQALKVMLDRAIRSPTLRKNTAAHAALRHVKVSPTKANVKRLVRAWDTARYAADLPTYRRHRALREALDAEKQASAFSGETLSI